MAKRENIVRHSSEELKAQKLESRTSQADLAAMTTEQIEKNADDEDIENGDTWDWARASIDMPKPKIPVSIRCDEDVLEFFKQDGRGYQTRMHVVLRSYVQHQKKKFGEPQKKRAR